MLYSLEYFAFSLRDAWHFVISGYQVESEVKLWTFWGQIEFWIFLLFLDVCEWLNKHIASKNSENFSKKSLSFELLSLEDDLKVARNSDDVIGSLS